MVQEERKHQETVMEQAASTISNNRRMITLNVGGIVSFPIFNPIDAKKAL